jgi:hypothetical protein
MLSVYNRMEQVELPKILRQHLSHSVDCSAYNCVRPPHRARPEMPLKATCVMR